jgi:hypothetical protein
LLCLLLGGCSTLHNPVPKGYSGPLATIDDSFKIHSSKTADMFYIQKVNNKDVVNTHRKSFGASSGQGGALVTQGHSHQLPALKTKLILSGETMHGAPIGYLFNAGSNYLVRGEVDFIPEANKHYLISGELSKERSAVWIENLKGDIVSQVVLIVEDNKESTVIPASQYEKKSGHSIISPSDEKKHKAALFSDISGGESIALVIEKIGKPDSVLYDDGNFFSNRRSHVDYVYDGLGKIRFSSRDKQAENVLRVFPELVINNEQLTNQLESSGLTLRHIAKEYYKKDTLSEMELDKIAGAIWDNRNKEDNYTEDAVAWLMKVIGKQGNSRYYSLISTLNDKKQYSSKISRYATKVLDQLEPSNINQFKYAG